MKNLLLMRHAKSSWSDPFLSDHDRPLNSRGRTDAPRMGEHLASMGIVPDIILCSTAKRAKQTAKYLRTGFHFDGQIEYFPSLYHGGTEEFLEVLGELEEGPETVMIIGHNPGMEFALEDFCGVDEVMPTAAIAHIQFDELVWLKIGESESGKLVALWRPKEI